MREEEVGLILHSFGDQLEERFELAERLDKDELFPDSSELSQDENEVLPKNFGAALFKQEAADGE